jgi:hypothetical protein
MNLTAIPLATSPPCTGLAAAGLEAILAGGLLGSIAVLAEALAEAAGEVPDPGGAPAAPSVLAAIAQQARKANAALAGGPGPWTDGSPSPILCHYI